MNFLKIDANTDICRLTFLKLNVPHYYSIFTEMLKLFSVFASLEASVRFEKSPKQHHETFKLYTVSEDVTTDYGHHQFISITCLVNCLVYKMSSD